MPVKYWYGACSICCAVADEVLNQLGGTLRPRTWTDVECTSFSLYLLEILNVWDHCTGGRGVCSRMNSRECVLLGRKLRGIEYPIILTVGYYIQLHGNINIHIDLKLNGDVGFDCYRSRLIRGSELKTSSGCQ